MTSTAVAPKKRNGTEQRSVIGRATSAVTDAGAQARTTAADASTVVAKHAPAAVAMSRGIVERVLTTLRGSSTGSLTLGTVFAAGVSGGMLLSRAPRALVAPAFMATLLLGGTLVGRVSARSGEPTRGTGA